MSYCKITSSNTSRLEAYVGFFRLLMKGIFGPYVLYVPFDKNLIFKLVKRTRTHNYTVVIMKIFYEFKKYLTTMQAKMLLRNFLHSILNQVECILQAILRDERLGETNALLPEGSAVHNCSILTLW